jgi:hypothetical protein
MVNESEPLVMARHPQLSECEDVRSLELTTMADVDVLRSMVKDAGKEQKCSGTPKIHRAKEGTSVGRILKKRNVITPLRSGENQ